MAAMAFKGWASRSLQIGIVLIWKRHLGGILHLLLVLSEKSLVNNSGRWGESRGGNKFLDQSLGMVRKNTA